MLTLDSSHVWHVAKAGNDNNGGHAQQYPVNLGNDAKLTIGAAITAASAGDTIIIWPGTYVEQVSVSKTLNLIGVNRAECIIQPSSGSAVLITADGTRVENLTCKTAESGQTCGISFDADDVVIDNCVCFGNNDGIYYLGGKRLLVKNTYAYSDYDGIQLGGIDGALIDSCIFETTGVNTTGSCRGFTTGVCKNVVVRNTAMKAVRSSGGNTNYIAAANIDGQVLFENCSFYAAASDPTEGYSAGVRAGMQSSSVLLRGCNIYSTAQSGYVYGAYLVAGELLLINTKVRVDIPGANKFSSSVTHQVNGQEKIEFRDTHSPYPGSAPDDYLNGWWIEWISGNNTGEKKLVDDWVTSDDHFYFADAFTYDIEVGDEYDANKFISYSLKRDAGILRLIASSYDKDITTGTIEQDGIGAINSPPIPYLGDFKEDVVLHFCWNTKDKDGASIARSTKGTIKVYKDDNTTGSTAGIADTEDFDGTTGVHHCKIDLSVDAFYEKGHDYSIVLNGAEIDGETINAVLATFSIENRFAGSSLFGKAAKVLVNKAVQNKNTGAIEYYDDDGQTIILTHTPTDEQSTITRTPS